jgi:hypothetical protein
VLRRSRSTNSPAASGSGRRRHVWLRLLLVLIVVFLVIDVLPTPWAWHIGGRFTPTQEWDGYGQLRASNGGKYVLFTHLRGSIVQGKWTSCSYRGCDSMYGNARLCTESGRTYTFSLTGKVGGWLTTNGSNTSIDLSGGQPAPLPEGWVVALHGSWRGPALSLSSPDNSFTEVFTARGAIRTTTSSADAGTASVTIRYGSAADFAQACRALPKAS